MSTAKEQFDRQATHYNTQWNTWSEELLQWLLDHADCQPTDTVLDVATGTGFTALAFAPRVQSVIGVDVSTGMMEQARQRQQEAGQTNVFWVEGSAEKLPFLDASFSMVTCRVAPHHFHSVPQFLAEVARVLQPGGRFLLADTSVPDDDSKSSEWQNKVEQLRDPSHVRNLSPQEWRTAIEEAGLRVEAIGEPNPDVPMGLNEWLDKAGCKGNTAIQVRGEFRNISEMTRRQFQIKEVANGDFTFVWQRVVAKAIKPQ